MDGWFSIFSMIVLKTAPKRPFLDTESATEWATRLKMAQNLLQVMCICFAVIDVHLLSGCFELLGQRFSGTMFSKSVLFCLFAEW